MISDEREETMRVHIFVYKEDYERIKELYGDTIGVSKAIRTMLRKFLRTVDAKTEPRRVETGEMDDII